MKYQYFSNIQRKSIFSHYRESRQKVCQRKPVRIFFAHKLLQHFTGRAILVRLRPNIALILQSSKIFPMKYQYWWNIGFISQIFGMKYQYRWNIGFTPEKFGIKHHFCRNIDFAFPIFAIKHHYGRNIGFIFQLRAIKHEYFRSIGFTFQILPIKWWNISWQYCQNSKYPF